METIKSKPTRYNGYEFRSRLEARWSVFFDSLGVKYHYEYMDFILLDGTRYLPDFYFPTFNGGCYGEVKPDGGFTEKVKDKCKQLCVLTGKSVMMLEGVPDFKWIDYFEIFNTGVGIMDGIPNADQAQYEDRMYAGSTDYDRDENGYCTQRFIYNQLGRSFIDAVYASRSAKFEFGQNGK